MEENNRTPENEGGEVTLKKAVMATLGTVAGAVEKAADAISSVVSRENIDKMAEKGEQAVKSARDFGTDAIRQVVGFGQEAFSKVKDTFRQEEDDDVRASLSRAADTLSDAMEKAREAVARAVSLENIEETGKGLMGELNEQKEKMAAFVQKMKRVAGEEAEMAKQELEDMLAEDAPESDGSDGETP